MNQSSAIVHTQITEEDCECLKRIITNYLRSDRNKIKYDEFTKILEKYFNTLNGYITQRTFIVNKVMYCMWFKCFSDACRVTDDIKIWAISHFAYQNFTIAVSNVISFWYASYLLKATLLLIGHNEQISLNFVKKLMESIRNGINVPSQLTFFEVVVQVIDNNKEPFANKIRQDIRQTFKNNNNELYALLGSITRTTFDVDSRIFINALNKDCIAPIIYPVLCYDAHLHKKELISPLKNGELWVDFNLKDANISIQCKCSCLRDNPPNSESEELDDDLTETIIINFNIITLVREKKWQMSDQKFGRVLIFNLDGACRCVFRSSLEATQSPDKLTLHIIMNDEMTPFLDMLSNSFSRNFKRLCPTRNSQAVVAQNERSRRNSAQFNDPHRVYNSMISCAHDNTGDSNQRFQSRRILVESKGILNSVEPDSRDRIETDGNRPSMSNWSADYNEGQNANQSLLTDIEVDSVIESSQDTNTRTILKRKMDEINYKLNPKPYNVALTNGIDEPPNQSGALPVTDESRWSIFYGSNKENEPSGSNILRTPGSSRCTSVVSFVSSTRSNSPFKPSHSQISNHESALLIDVIDLVSPRSESTDTTVNVFENSMLSMDTSDSLLTEVSHRLNNITARNEDIAHDIDNELNNSLRSISRVPSVILSGNYSHYRPANVASQSTTEIVPNIPEKKQSEFRKSFPKFKLHKSPVTRSNMPELDFMTKSSLAKVATKRSRLPRTSSRNLQSLRPNCLTPGTSGLPSTSTSQGALDLNATILRIPFKFETKLAGGQILKPSIEGHGLQKRKSDSTNVNKTVDSIRQENSTTQNLNTTAGAILNCSNIPNAKRFNFQPSIPVTQQRRNLFNFSQQNIIAPSQNIQAQQCNQFAQKFGTIQMSPGIRGRPRKTSCSQTNVSGISELATSANCSLKSTALTESQKKRTRKRPQVYKDFVTDDEISFKKSRKGKGMTNIEDEETRHVRRYTTKTRTIQKPVRYTDELNETFLAKHDATIRRKKINGCYTDTVIMNNPSQQELNRSRRLNQTADDVMTYYPFSDDSRANLCLTEKRKKKRLKYPEYQVIRLDNLVMRLSRLSRANSECKLNLLTQEPVKPREGTGLSQAQIETIPGWNEIFERSTITRNGQQSAGNRFLNLPHQQVYEEFLKWLEHHKRFDGILDAVACLHDEDQKLHIIQKLKLETENEVSADEKVKLKFADYFVRGIETFRPENGANCRKALTIVKQ